ncbi:hypothetical protein Tco_1280829 [Tanacetum coccineum]
MKGPTGSPCSVEHLLGKKRKKEQQVFLCSADRNGDAGSAAVRVSRQQLNLWCDVKNNSVTMGSDTSAVTMQSEGTECKENNYSIVLRDDEYQFNCNKGYVGKPYLDSGCKSYE